jgi:hypothetical protein
MPERQRTSGYLGLAEEAHRLSDIPPRRTLPAGRDSQTTLHEAEPFLDPDFNTNPSSTPIPLTSYSFYVRVYYFHC